MNNNIYNTMILNSCERNRRIYIYKGVFIQFQIFFFITMCNTILIYKYIGRCRLGTNLVFEVLNIQFYLYIYYEQ